VDQGEREALLVARSGRHLKHWQHVEYAALVDRPAELGGGSLAIVGHALTAPPQCSGRLCAYDPGLGYKDPIWSMRIADDDVPESMREQHPTIKGFSVREGAVFDVFEDVPGTNWSLPLSTVTSHRPRCASAISAGMC
jgi:hypothetical protein